MSFSTVVLLVAVSVLMAMVIREARIMLAFTKAAYSHQYQKQKRSAAEIDRLEQDLKKLKVLKYLER